jgi:hypothetical protein
MLRNMNTCKILWGNYLESLVFKASTRLTTDTVLLSVRRMYLNSTEYKLSACASLILRGKQSLKL